MTRAVRERRKNLPETCLEKKICPKSTEERAVLHDC